MQSARVPLHPSGAAACFSHAMVFPHTKPGQGVLCVRACACARVCCWGEGVTAESSKRAVKCNVCSTIGFNGPSTAVRSLRACACEQPSQTHVAASGRVRSGALRCLLACNGRVVDTIHRFQDNRGAASADDVLCKCAQRRKGEARPRLKSVSAMSVSSVPGATRWIARASRTRARPSSSLPAYERTSVPARPPCESPTPIALASVAPCEHSQPTGTVRRSESAEA